MLRLKAMASESIELQVSAGEGQPRALGQLARVSPGDPWDLTFEAVDHEAFPAVRPLEAPAGTPEGVVRTEVFETYDDHRMAHAAAVIGLTVPGVNLTDATAQIKGLVVNSVEGLSYDNVTVALFPTLSQDAALGRIGDRYTVASESCAFDIIGAEYLRDVLPGGNDDWHTDSGLLDPSYHQAMFRFREEHLIGGAARRLKRGIDDGMDPGEVFSRVQDHVITAARAHVERLMLDDFVARVEGLPDGDLKVALNLLCDLHALSGIEADRAWFMEHGRLTSQRSKAISREINSLCRRLRPLAVDLVDGFGVPPEMLRAPDLVG